MVIRATSLTRIKKWKMFFEQETSNPNSNKYLVETIVHKLQYTSCNLLLKPNCYNQSDLPD